MALTEASPFNSAVNRELRPNTALFVALAAAASRPAISCTSLIFTPSSADPLPEVVIRSRAATASRVAAAVTASCSRIGRRYPPLWTGSGKKPLARCESVLGDRQWFEHAPSGQLRNILNQGQSLIRDPVRKPADFLPQPFEGGSKAGQIGQHTCSLG